MSEERRAFQAEVGRILDLMVHSVYSDKEIFLRELISNAADACDRLRYRAIAEPELLDGDGEFRIRIEVDKAARTIAVTDNGEGMAREELVENLGTIARSGTAAFADRLTGDAKNDVALIGQFGVGFYSAFMVAERVRVVSRAAGAEEAFAWESDGRGEFTDLGGGAGGARHRNPAASEGRRGRIPGAGPAADGGQDLFRPYRGSGRDGRRDGQ